MLRGICSSKLTQQEALSSVSGCECTWILWDSSLPFQEPQGQLHHGTVTLLLTARHSHSNKGAWLISGEKLRSLLTAGTAAGKGTEPAGKELGMAQGRHRVRPMNDYTGRSWDGLTGKIMTA